MLSDEELKQLSEIDLQIETLRQKRQAIVEGAMARSGLDPNEYDEEDVTPLKPLTVVR